MLTLHIDPYDCNTKIPCASLPGLLAFQPMLAQAEDPDPVRDLKPPKNRELFHDFVEKQQKDI
jgi:hypothetical protein